MTDHTESHRPSHPTPDQVFEGVRRSVASVLTTTDGVAVVDEQDLFDAVAAGVSMAFAGLIVVNPAANSETVQ